MKIFLLVFLLVVFLRIGIDEERIRSSRGSTSPQVSTSDISAYVDQISLLESVRGEILDKVSQRRVALEKSCQGWSEPDLHTRVTSMFSKEKELSVLRDRIRKLEEVVTSKKQLCDKRPNAALTVPQKVSTLARLSSKETEKVEIDLRSISHLLSIRRMQLLTELSALYKIDYQGKMRTIGGLVIPPITTLKRCDVRDEENIATALGYLAHRVEMASKIINFPLRYRIKPLGSRSLIQDTSGEFPLYYKVRDHARFVL